MSAITSDAARRIAINKTLLLKAKSALSPVLYTSMVPLMPPLLNGIVGAYKGYQRAALENEAHEYSLPVEIDNRYSPVGDPEDGFTDRTMIGMGMELGWYKAKMAQVEKEKGVLSQEEKKSFYVDQMTDMTPISVTDDIATRHMSYVGKTGVGKTEAMLAMLKQSVDRGGGGIIYEAKGEMILAQRAYEICKAAGKAHKFRVISFEDLKLSHTYNPFVGDNVRALISMASKLQKEGGEPFFDAVSYEGLMAAIVLFTRQKVRSNFNFKDLYMVFNEPNEFLRLYETMAERTPQERDDKIFISTFINGFKGYDPKQGEYFKRDKWGTFFKGLTSSIAPFANSIYGGIVNSYDPDINLRQSIEDGEVLVVSMSGLSDAKGVSIFGQIFLADLARAIGDIQTYGTKPRLIYPVWLDEYASFKHIDHKELFQLARSANISLAISIQDINQLKLESDEFAKIVLGQCWTNVFFDIADQDSRDIAYSMAGTVIREFEQKTEATNQGQSGDSTESGAIHHTWSQGRSVSSGTKAMREELLQPEDLMLDAGDAIVIGKNETYKVRMPFVMFDGDPLDLHAENLVRFDKHNGRGMGLYEKAGFKSHAHLISG